MELLKEVARLKENYNSSVDIMDGLSFSQAEVIKMIEFYTNSKYLNGDYDEFGRLKPFYNIINFRVDVATKATDLDTKDIQIYSENPKHRIKSMLFSKAIKNWMRKTYFSKVLNEINFTRAKYGGVLVKKVMRDGELYLEVPEWKNLITDQIDIKNGFKMEKHYLTPVEIQAKSDVWEGVKENKELIQKILKKGKRGSFTSSDRLCVLEMEAELPVEYVSDSGNEYSLQKHIILTNSDEEPVAVLHSEEVKKSQYKYLTWRTASGRGLGIGIAEDGFHAQIASNDTVMKEKDIMEIASKVLFLTDSQVLENNIMGESLIGDIIKVDKGEQFNQVNTTPSSLPQLSNILEKWDEQYSRTSSTHESVTGETMPASTPFRSLAIQNQEAQSTFNYRKEEMGIFLNEILTDWVIPHLTKIINKDFILASDFEDDELLEIDEAFINDIISEKIWTDALAGKPTSEEELNELKEVERQQLKKTQKNKRYIEIPKDYFKDVEFKIDVITTGEQVNKQAVFETLANLMQFVQDPIKRNKIMAKIVELSGIGLSPSVFETPDQPQQPTNATPEVSPELLQEEPQPVQ